MLFFIAQLLELNLIFSILFVLLEYNDDRFEIASGSSVIVKRVPAELVPSAT